MKRPWAWLGLAVVIGLVPAARGDDEAFKKVLKDTFKDQKPEEVRRELLWPNGAPGAKGDTDDDKPSVDIYLPAKDKATGAAVVVLPGGGYAGLAIGHEGREVGEFFRDHGVAAFVTRYRLGSAQHGGYRHPIMLQDAQRAVRWARSHAADLGYSPKRVGLMGFSAGGHLASTVGTHFDAGDTSAPDPIDRVSCRPDFLILAYPVISLTAPFTHKGSVVNLLGGQPDPKVLEDLSNDTRVTQDTPPTFLFHTDQDNGVPVENSVAFYVALHKAHVPAELHIYRAGPHGVGLGKHQPLLAGWPEVLVSWMKGLGLFEPPTK